MIPTVPIDLLLNVTLGSSVALAARVTVGTHKLFRSPALWSLVAVEVLVFLPIGAYLLLKYPAWSLMYLVDAGSLPVPDYALAFSYPIVGVLSFLVARQLLKRSRATPVVVVCLGAFVGTGLITYFGQAQLLVVGSTQAFRSAPEAMRSSLDSPLLYLVAGAGVALTSSWAVTLWRLYLLGRAVGSGSDTAATAVVQKSTEKSPAKQKKRRGKKKAS